MEIRIYEKKFLIRKKYDDFKISNVSEFKKILKIRGRFDGILNISIACDKNVYYSFKRISCLDDSTKLLTGKRICNHLFFSDKKNLSFECSIKKDQEIFYWLERVELGVSNDTIKGSIDELELTKTGCLKCRGWIFDSVQQVENIYARFEKLNNSELIQEFLLVKRRRADVRNLFKNKSFLFSGFDFECSVSTTEDIALYISYYSGSNVKKMFVKNISSNSNSSNNIFFQKGELKSLIEYDDTKSNIPNAYWEFKNHKIQKLIFKHNLGGGAEIFIQKQIDLWRKSEELCTLSYIPETNEYLIELYLNETKYTYYCAHLDWFLKEILADLKEIWINELVSYPDVFEVLKWIEIVLDVKRISLKMFIHDYFCLCPRIVLLKGNNEYCNIPSLEECDKCLKSTESEETDSILSWREQWGKVLQKSELIICFSNDTKRLLQSVYNSENIRDKIIVRPHEIKTLKKAIIQKDNIVTIGLLGNLTEHKGLHKVLELSKYIKDNCLENVRLVLIGMCDSLLVEDNFIVTGKYNVEDLPFLVEKYNVDVFFMSSICPETFSFTVSEMMELGLPIISYDLGAQGERVKMYEKGHVIPLYSKVEDVLKIILRESGERGNDYV